VTALIKPGVGKMLVRSGLATLNSMARRHRTLVFAHHNTIARRSDTALHLPPGSPGHLRTLRSFLTHRPSVDRGEVLRFSDPAPGLREMAGRIRGG